MTMATFCDDGYLPGCQPRRRDRESLLNNRLILFGGWQAKYQHLASQAVWMESIELTQCNSFYSSLAHAGRQFQPSLTGCQVLQFVRHAGAKLLGMLQGLRGSTYHQLKNALTKIFKNTKRIRVSCICYIRCISALVFVRFQTRHWLWDLAMCPAMW